MTLEDIRWSCDNFPVGMRVLAVDDNPTCLMLLEGLLKKCQYQVTTTSQARIALKMLRENKDRFDLVISDVQMPDMDGFKLLELVGLEMDLPVIMLSGNGDNKLVLKGITHGACDYLLKPVRLEELKNIWQHVVRKKKVHPKNLSKSEDQDKDHQGKEPQLSEQNKQLNKKRKEEEEYESDENGNDSDDTTTQKKPRVVWSIELHRKFVAAVNQLGLEKAVPKRILDLMNVEGITRENVASHLQKYRLYLKKTSEQASMVAAFGGKDSAYVQMGSLDGLSSFRTLAGSGRFGQQPTLSSSYTSAGAMLSSRLNSAAGLGLHNLTSSLQPNHGRTLTNSSNALMKLNPNVPHSVLNGSLFQGIPPSLELDQLQQHKHGLNPLCNVSNNPTLLQPLTGAGFGNQQSLNIATFSSDSFNSGVSGSSDYLDHGSGSDNWHSSIQSLKFQSSSFPLTQPFSNTHLAQDRVRDDYTLAGPQLQNSTINFSSSTTVFSSPLEVSRGETQRHESLGGAALPNQMWQDQISNNFFGNMSSQVPGNGVMVSVTHNIEQNNETFGRKVDPSLIGRSNGGSLGIIQHSESENLTPDLRTRTNEDYLLEATKQHIGFLPRGHDSLDDLVSAMKREQDGSILEGGDFGFDAYSFVSGI